MIKKFPITSENDNEYLVSIKEDYDIGGRSLFVSLSEKVKKKNIFGKSKEVLVCVYSKSYEDCKEEYFDYVLATKTTVAKYEKSPSYIKKATVNQCIKNFNEWNGDCKWEPVE